MNENQKEKERNGASSSSPEKQEVKSQEKDGNSSYSRDGSVGYVYFLETPDSSFVKIGYTLNVGKRICELQQHAPGSRLVGYMPGTRQTERHLHERFQGHRYFGEWFKFHDDLREFVIDIPKDIPPPRDTVKMSPSLKPLDWKCPGPRLCSLLCIWRHATILTVEECAKEIGVSATELHAIETLGTMDVPTLVKILRWLLEAE